MTFKTEQEAFWAGDFGTEYIKRNQGEKTLASNLNFFSKALRDARELKSCIEFGANIGMNLKALKLLYPTIDLYAIEINANAVRDLAKIIPADHIFHTSILQWSVPPQTWDLTLSKGLLIHINPDDLYQVYDKLVASTKRYLLIAEYYNPIPVAIPYRGHSDRLFKRDFAGEIMARHPEMKLLDYGFVYSRDPNFPQDDVTWFLMEKMT
ncbi:MAG TPA: hypothetical protein PKE45_09960 [Caldilineaceae bacterium]|nr:hypothetical protein [Caldilineaceae bacterium]